MGHFQLFLMILKFSMGHFLSFYTDFYGPFSKLMGLWRMAPCLPNHCVLCVNDYIWYLFFFIYYCLYCLHHNLSPYIVSLYWIKKSREINRKNWWFMYNPIVARHSLSDAIQKTVFSLTKYAIIQQRFISTDNVFLPS